MTKIIFVAYLWLFNSLVQAQLHGNPGGGGPGKGNEEYNLCMDFKITIEEYSRALLKLEKKEYKSQEDFFKFIDDEIFKIAVWHWDILNHPKIKKNEKFLLPCGKEEEIEAMMEKNEKLEILKEIVIIIERTENGSRYCQDVIIHYSRRLKDIKAIIKYYEDQQKRSF